VRVLSYKYTEPKDHKTHPWVSTFNRGVDRGVTVYRALEVLDKRGFRPDVVVAHSGWGEAMFVRDVWPEVRLGVFSEFFYQAEGADIGFDPEFDDGPEFGRTARVRLRNLAMRQQLEAADASFSPTRWQAETYPPELREKIEVIFDGIRTDIARPDARAAFQHGDSPRLTRADEVITFVNRNLEPYRGFHVFMRALPALLRARPNAQVVLVGEDGVSYGAAPKGGGSWKARLLEEVGPQLAPADRARVHFVGRIPYDSYIALLQVSTVHVYLTYPFVLSWSLMEAMSAGCAIVASDTAPVREVMRDGETGVLVDFFDTAALAGAVGALADDPARRAALGAAARQHVVARYDLENVCLPQQFDWVARLAGGPV
jgi:glycosyltransferase involved in cell wall biosynthesis